ncbi:MAG: nucleoside monophosphate kinase [Bacilli bacterium]|nr:nucleoside monophosphate kinase [Bacilli bacterium]
MKNVIFIAPPAAGKGTQSNRLVDLGYIHISTGDMLREEIAKESSVGLKIKDIISKGMLVSDEIVFELITDKLKTINKPFILDGFPRTSNQAKLLDTLFNDLGIIDYEVIYLDISLEEALKRALGRLTCKCGASYNSEFSKLKPKVTGICDKCGSILEKRSDDNEESFKVRFETFIKNNDPIKDFYENKNKLHIIDTTLDTEIITDRIKDILKK